MTHNDVIQRCGGVDMLPRNKSTRSFPFVIFFNALGMSPNSSDNYLTTPKLFDLEEVPLNINSVNQSNELATVVSGPVPKGKMNSENSAMNSRSPVSGESLLQTSSVYSIVPSSIQDAKHPYVCLFHVLFKLSAISSYWFMFAILKNVVITFICTTIFLAFDFWTVKNITGRFLVGLRWWNEGTWKFESSKSMNIDENDKRVFWTGLMVFPLFWLITSISTLLSLSANFFILSLMGLGFSTCNFWGYWKCWRSISSQETGDVTSWAAGEAMKIIASSSSSSVNV